MQALATPSSWTELTFPLVARASIFVVLLGLVNGMVAASKNVVSEVCGTEHDTVGMGLLTSSWSIGAVLGPGVGGMLAEPAIKYSGTFSESGVFGRNPYLLSNLVGAGLSLVSLPLVLLFLKDTKGRGLGTPTGNKEPWHFWCSRFFSRFFRLSRNDNGNSYSLNTAEGGGEDRSSAAATKHIEYDVSVEIEASDGSRKPSWMLPETMPPSVTTNGTGNGSIPDAAENLRRKMKDLKPESLLKQRHVVILLLMEAIYATTYSGFDEVYALWALSSASKGGLEWSSQQLGQVYVACGLMVLLFEMVAVPYLTPWLGVKLSQRLGSVFEVPIYFFFPLISRIGGGDLPVKLTTLIMLFTGYVCTNSFFVGTSLAINTASPDRRGELNGISMMITSVVKASSPIVSASVFAWSINGNHSFPFNHHFIFALLGSMRLIAACIGWNRITDNGNME